MRCGIPEIFDYESTGWLRACEFIAKGSVGVRGPDIDPSVRVISSTGGLENGSGSARSIISIPMLNASIHIFHPIGIR